MPTEVVMPQMGESITEGTITKWLKKPGESVERDEPLFEISTDKVDAEIPSPAAGTLQEIKSPEGSTVQINTVVALIGEAGAKPAASPSRTPETAAAPAADSAEPAAVSAPMTDLANPPSAPGTESGAQPATEADQPSAGTEVLMPQMGESITEGTITKWLKKVGDTVQRDEPIFEISTDKVDAEIPSPVAGKLSEIKVQEGQTVTINTVVAVIGGGTSAPAAKPAPSARPPFHPPLRRNSRMASLRLPRYRFRLSGRARPFLAARSQDRQRQQRRPRADLRAQEPRAASPKPTSSVTLKAAPPPRRPHHRPLPPPHLSPPTSRPSPPRRPPRPQKPPPPLRPCPASSSPCPRCAPSSRSAWSSPSAPAAHVHTVFKVDMTRIVKLREKEKNKYEQRNGVKLTYMPFITRAAVAALRKHPIVNAATQGDAILYNKNINIGIAVALDWGLIVPVIKQAEEKNFLGIARSIVDVADRARNKKLAPDEVSGGTFTLTNSGIFGEQFGTPIIDQPQSAILGIGGLNKEAVVLTDKDGNDTIAIRSIQRFTLGFDHRIIDGADAGKFMSDFKSYLENWSEDIG